MTTKTDGGGNMVEVKMPEPVSWVRRHPDGALTAEFLEDAVMSPVRKESGAWLPMVTTTQVEAYADARVREALINAANKVADPTYIEATIENFAWVSNGNYARAHLILQDAVDAIRTLIPKENKS